MLLQLTVLSDGEHAPSAMLGPWSRNGSIPVVSRPWFERDRDEEFSRLCAIYNEVIDQISEWSAISFNLDRSRQFWEVVYYRTISHYVMNYFAQHLYVKEVINSAPALVPIIMALDEFETPRTSSDLGNRYYRSDRFLLETLSLVCSHIAPKCACMNARNVASDSAEASAPKLPIRSWRGYLRGTPFARVRSWYRDRRPAIHSDGAVVLHSSAVPPGEVDAVARGVRFRVVPSHKCINPGRATLPSTDLALRRSLADFADVGSIAGSIVRGLSRHLPVELLEGFKANHKRAAEYFDGGGHPTAVIGAYFKRVYDQIWIAEAQSRGARLFVVQHGGAYGETTRSLIEVIERRVSNTFVTWGWGDGTPRTVSVVPFRLSDYRSAPPSGANPDTLLMLTPKRTDRPEMSLVETAPQAEIEEEFVRQLDRGIRQHTILRLRTNKYTREAEQAPWRRGYPELTIDHMERPILAQLHRAKLVVLSSYFSTTFLECLAMNKPVLVFGPLDWGAVHPRAVEHYAAMFRTGVFIADPAEASAVVTDIFDDPIAWWGESERSIAVKRFARTFAGNGEIYSSWQDLVVSAGTI